jgi:protein SCO1/2
VLISDAGAMSSRLLLVVVALVAAALGVASWLLLGPRQSPLPAINGYVLAQPRALPAIELVDEQGARFEPREFAGHWSFLYFGYTYCPDVCPLTLVELAALKKQLAVDLPGERSQYFLVSVDPKRDTPERLREYVAYFDPAFRALTGAPAALAAFAAATETLVDVPEGQDPANYLVSHSSNVVLLDPRGELRAVLTPPHDPLRLAADFGKIVAHDAEAR